MLAYSGVMQTWTTPSPVRGLAHRHNLHKLVVSLHKAGDMQVTSDLPEAFSVLGFAFYVQPMMMPLLHEMPAGQRGIVLTTRAVYIVVMGVAMAVYGVVGISAAARYGLETQGNVLVNNWLGGLPEGVLDAVMAVYLSISIPPMQVRWGRSEHQGMHRCFSDGACFPCMARSPMAFVSSTEPSGCLLKEDGTQIERICRDGLFLGRSVHEARGCFQQQRC